MPGAAATIRDGSRAKRQLPWQSIDDCTDDSRRSLRDWLRQRIHEARPQQRAASAHALGRQRQGLTRLKRRFVIGTLSNGNVALLVDMAKHGGLPWDCVLSAELFHHYKPDPEAYLGAAAILGLAPREVMLVAAHKNDLAAARKCGFSTAFVRRPLEHGPQSTPDLTDDRRCTLNADDFVDLARQLGA